VDVGGTAKTKAGWWARHVVAEFEAPGREGHDCVWKHNNRMNNVFFSRVQYVSQMMTGDGDRNLANMRQQQHWQTKRQQAGCM